MMKHAVSPSEIWPDFAKSEILPKSGIWLFPFGFRGLEGPFQISEGCFQNLLRNLDLINKISVLRQISDFRKVPPKGVGVLPATGGEDTTYPWAISRAAVWPDPPLEQPITKGESPWRIKP